MIEEDDFEEPGEFMTPDDREQYKRIVIDVRDKYCAERGLDPSDLTDEQVEEVVNLGRGPVEASGLAAKYREDFLRRGLEAHVEKLLDKCGSPDAAVSLMEAMVAASKRGPISGENN